MIEERSRNYFERDIQRRRRIEPWNFYLRPLENDIYGHAGGMEQMKRGRRGGTAGENRWIGVQADDQTAKFDTWSPFAKLTNVTGRVFFSVEEVRL